MFNEIVGSAATKALATAGSPVAIGATIGVAAGGPPGAAIGAGAGLIVGGIVFIAAALSGED
jgi:hypothetical protein